MRRKVALTFIIALVQLMFQDGLVAQAVLIDRTGSMARQKEVESELRMALPAAALRFQGIRLIFFSDDPLNAPPLTLMFERPSTTSGIPRLKNALLERSMRQTAQQLSRIFAVPTSSLSPATNIPAALKRAGEELPHGLLLTDGLNETPSRMNQVTSAYFTVILCPALIDTGANTLARLEERERLIKIWAPHATVFPCFNTRDAVLEWLSPQSIVTPILRKR